MNLFVMVTTEASRRYTDYALTTFFIETPLDPRDRFLLIDNDGGYKIPEEIAPLIELITNPAPLGFAENMNQGFRAAEEESRNLFLLNDDLIFTKGWFEPLLGDDSSITSPLSSREVHYDIGDFHCGTPMELEYYLENQDKIPDIIQAHQGANHRRKLNSLTVPFFAVRIPNQIISTVGHLDERFGKGGAEDYDYCLRAILEGFSVAYCMESYLLHFGGKSSWSGAESKGQQNSREAQFKKVFRETWGDKLTSIILNEEVSIIYEDPELRPLAQSGNLKEVIRRLRDSSSGT